MCGIVGYIGPKSIDSVLLVGLKKLEYRGYDSSGIAAIENGELNVRKSNGKISNLEEKLSFQKLSGHIGIGHTRWATHGEPSKNNAHPHTNQKKTIAVVHNGIIENYLELKHELTKQGMIFRSETDTEVIPHLIQKFFNQGLNALDAFLATLKKLEGKFAISMICEKDPNKIFFARNGAPLIIAAGKKLNNNKYKEIFVASDSPAFIPIAKTAYHLRDEEWGYIEENQIHLFNLSDKEAIDFTLEEIPKSDLDIEKGDYAHYMLKEIFEQSDMFRRILKRRISDNNKIQFDELKLDPEYLNKIGRISIQACGTSLNAGLVGKYYFEQMAKLFTDADYSSEFRYRNPVADGDSLIIGISQSGETADTIGSLYEGKAKHLKVLSFLNNVNSTMARESDGIIDLMAGPEIGVASTKAYTAELLNLFLFSLYISSIKWTLPKEERVELIQELKELPDKIDILLKNLEPIHTIANYLKDRSDTIFLGRTFNYPTALEGALKLKEISYIHASGYAGGEFKHGPIALVSEEVPVIFILPEGEIRTKMISNLQEVKARKGKIISIITEGDEEVKKISDYYVEIPKTHEYLSPMLSVIPLQLISYFTAVYRGTDVDQPRNLAKSVTVE